MTTTPPKVHLESLRAGSKIFYPGHGVALVVRLEEREFGQAKQMFYVLERTGGGTLMLPENKLEQAGLRELVSESTARELVERFKVEPAVPVEVKTDHAARKARAAVYAEGLRSGSPDRYTAILHELLGRARTDKLSHAEKQALEIARGYFIGEVSVVLGRTPDEVAAILDTPP